MGVSFASVNRWENGQSRPSALAWQQIDRAEKLGVEALSKDYLEIEHASVATPRRTEAPTRLAESPINIDFSTDPEVVRAVAEGERLAYGHLIDPAFATETSLIDPLPQQRIAVYEHICSQLVVMAANPNDWTIRESPRRRVSASPRLQQSKPVTAREITVERKQGRLFEG